MRVSAIIPAYNEEKTICDVLAVLEKHPAIDEIIVVDDGSTDSTASRVEKTRARLIRNPVNQGKGSAMNRGVQAARNEIIFFLDADIQGLTPEMITALIEPVASGACAMYVAIRDRRLYWLNRILYFAPILGGERVLTKDIWHRIPEKYRQNFQVEIALNFYAKRLGRKMGFAVMPGLTHVIKEKKHGVWLGLRERFSMILDIVIISFRLYMTGDVPSPRTKPHKQTLVRKT